MPNVYGKLTNWSGAKCSTCPSYNTSKRENGMAYCEHNSCYVSMDSVCCDHPDCANR